MFAGEANLKDHDPNNINDHLKVRFQDVLAEPRGSHSPSCVWMASETCFTLMFSLCYGLSVCPSCLCTSIYWGAEMGYISFIHVWYMTPFAKCVNFWLYIPAFCLRTCTRCVMDPWCESASYIFMFCQKPPSGKHDDWNPWSTMYEKV